MVDWFDLSGKCALITGGGGLLGPEHGIALAKCGSAVILADISEKGLELARQRITSEVPNAMMILAQTDISNEDELVRLKDKLSMDKLQIDILVNNASVNPKMDCEGEKGSCSVEAYDLSELEREVRIGITGSFLCCKVFGSLMAERGHGVIINVASDLAVQAPDQRIYSPTGRIEDVKNFKPIGYSIVKSAMLGLNRYLATYWAHRGVRVNCLLPGGVYNNQPAHLVDQLKERIPLRRMANCSEYQGAIAFLASEASSYMTGQMLIMDGGRSIW